MAKYKNEKLHEDKKQQLINSTLSMIMTYGFNAFSLNQLLVNVQMSKGSFFHYFKSKKELLDAVVADSSQTIISGFIMLGESEIDAKEKIVALYKMSSEQRYTVNNEANAAKDIYTLENKTFMDLITKYVEPYFLEFLVNTITEGNKAEVFRVKHVRGTAEHILILTLGINAKLSEVFLIDGDEESLKTVGEMLGIFDGLVGYLLGVEFENHLYSKIL